MKKTSSESPNNVQEPSSGSTIFKLKSITPQNKNIILNARIDFGDLVNKNRGIFSGEKILEEQQRCLLRMFGYKPTSSESPLKQPQDEIIKNIENINKFSEKCLEFPEKIQQKDNEGSETIYVAAPSYKKCLICRQSFENYFQHIATSTHKKKFNITGQQLKVYIDELMKSLQKQRALKKQKAEKQKKLKTEVTEDYMDAPHPSKKKATKYITSTTSSQKNQASQHSLLA